MIWIGFRGAGGGLRPSAPTAWLAIGGGLPARLSDRPQHRGLGRHRRRLRRGDRRRPHHPRPDRLGPASVPLRQSLRRHLRPVQLLRLRPVRARASVARHLGRPPRRPRRRDLLRPGHGRRAVRAWDVGSARESPRRHPRLRLGRLPVHRLRAPVQLERHPDRGPARLGPGRLQLADQTRRPAGSCDAREVRSAGARPPVRRGSARLSRSPRPRPAPATLAVAPGPCSRSPSLGASP